MTTFMTLTWRPGLLQLEKKLLKHGLICDYQKYAYKTKSQYFLSEMEVVLHKQPIFEKALVRLCMSHIYLVNVSVIFSIFYLVLYAKHYFYIG